VRLWILPLLMLSLASCGGTAPPKPATPPDETLQRETNAGRLAYELEHPDEAVAQYRIALTRAQARDDLKAIGELGYNLSVAELRAGLPDRALADARATRLELDRRGAQPFPALLLAEATALYRTGAAAEADAMAARVAAGNDTEAAARAMFLRGVMADERGDDAGLARAAEAIRQQSAPSLQADAAELAARLALRRADASRARQEADRAARLRQDTLDYRGLSRALGIEAEAAQRAGDSPAAADLFLRAGRSALAQGDKPAARAWLQRAATLAPGDPVGVAAGNLLDSMDQIEK
jgi:hypothetical protein